MRWIVLLVAIVPVITFFIVYSLVLKYKQQLIHEKVKQDTTQSLKKASLEKNKTHSTLPKKQFESHTRQSQSSNKSTLNQRTSSKQQPSSSKRFKMDKHALKEAVMISEILKKPKGL